MSSTTDQFDDALTARLASNGFLARLLVVECRERGDGRDDVNTPLPESVVAAARWWAEFRPGGNLAAEHPDPVTVPGLAPPGVPPPEHEQVEQGGPDPTAGAVNPA